MKIEVGNPSQAGMYVCFVEAGVSQYPEKKLLMWYDGWSYPSSDQKYRGIIYGWIGPLPAPSIHNLKYLHTKYAITNMVGREFDSYKQGVFNTLEEAMECSGDEGDFIWEISADGEKKAISKWSEKKQDWIFRKKQK